MSEYIDFYGSITRNQNTSKSESSNSSNSKKKPNQYKIYSTYIQNYDQNDSQVKKLKLNEQKETRVECSEEEMEQEEPKQDFSESFIGLKTFQYENVFTDFANNDYLIICLEKNSGKNNLLFKGRCSFALLFGFVQINGFEINDHQSKWYQLYSPETNSHLAILNKQDMPGSEFNELEYQNILRKLRNNFNLNIEAISNDKFREFLVKNNFHTGTSSLLVIRPLKSQLCNYICYFDNFQQVYQNSLGFNENEINRSDMNQFDCSLHKFGIFPVSEEFFNAVHIENDNERLVIEEVLLDSDKNTEGSVIMPCGGKDVGKSTFLRYLMNRLLNKYQHVAYIDCDPGQSEFTLASCLSFNLISEPLFGPPHTHLNHNGPNKKCYFLGHLSPNDIPGVYLHYLQKCFEEYLSLKSRSNKVIPLVINTMGWNNGLGLCLLKETMIMFKPSHVIQINHPVEANKNMPILDYEWIKTADGWPAKNRFQNLRTELNLNYKLITLKSNAPCKNSKFTRNPPQKSLSAKDHRNIAILAYFAKLNESDVYFKPIHHLRPYRISWSKLALHVIHSRVDYEQFFRVFNASLVCLSSIDQKFIKRRHENKELPGYLNLFEYTVDIKCLGFGIVRGINMETKEFYILTPEPIEILNQVNLLCKGMLNLPMEFFCEQESMTPSPYMSIACSNQNRTSFDQISNEPLQRKYLIHQTVNKKN
ncbi:unnamed protein product [Brachionus calyciflorus]|uniref:Polynucleotide 5'-hydroxyl-kinase NOL9 n=1 Tax=Brachionus calyciflorus TaxID=104777 RepID=A0A813XLX0_9BILA|nr:unnamed protein product [Brachionus calyciflorus]